MKFKVLILFSLVNLIGFSQSLEESIQSISNLPDSVQADSMTRLARLSLIDENPILGLKQVKWALELANRKKIKNIIPFARFYTARIFSNINQYDSSLVHYKKALIEIENTKYDKWEIYIVKGIGNIYRQKGDFKNAIAIQLNALKGFEEKGDSLNLAELYTEIGYSYDRMKDFNTALIYHRKAIDYLQEKDPYFKNFIVGRIAIAYDDLGDYDSAHYYNFRALSFEVKNGDSAGVGMTCSNIGNTFIKQRNWPKAEAFLKRANRLNLIHGDNGNKAISHINLGNVQIELEQFNKASSTLNKGIQYSKSWLNSKFLSEAY